MNSDLTTRLGLEYRLERLKFARFWRSNALREVVTALKTQESATLREKRAALIPRSKD
jgi:hypothetical protein